jgi:hypothetical protein
MTDSGWDDLAAFLSVIIIVGVLAVFFSYCFQGVFGQ